MDGTCGIVPVLILLLSLSQKKVSTVAWKSATVGFTSTGTSTSKSNVD